MPPPVGDLRRTAHAKSQRVNMPPGSCAYIFTYGLFGISLRRDGKGIGINILHGGAGHEGALACQFDHFRIAA